MKDERRKANEIIIKTKRGGAGRGSKQQKYNKNKKKHTALQSLATRPAPIISLPRLTVPIVNGTYAQTRGREPVGFYRFGGRRIRIIRGYPFPQTN